MGGPAEVSFPDFLCEGPVAKEPKSADLGTLILERAGGAPRWALSPLDVWRVGCLCHMHSKGRARCRGVVFIVPTY